MPEVNNYRKNHGQSYPNGAPDHSFPEFDGVAAAMKYAQIEHQHRNHESVE
jgi:hypothetical protein